MGGVGFEVTRNVTFLESGLSNMYYRKINNSHKEPIEGIKVWILLGCSRTILGCPSNILGYPSK